MFPVISLIAASASGEKWSSSEEREEQRSALTEAGHVSQNSRVFSSRLHTLPQTYRPHRTEPHLSWVQSPRPPWERLRCLLHATPGGRRGRGTETLPPVEALRPPTLIPGLNGLLSHGIRDTCDR